ncbi:unnamed protein product, partial [Staurois parvus]
KRPDWKGVKVSGLEGGESVWTGSGLKCPDWNWVKVSGLEVGVKAYGLEG